MKQKNLMRIRGRYRQFHNFTTEFYLINYNKVIKH